MDITFQTAEGRFNLRACAVILREGAVLTMRDDRSPYSYLPGGRVALQETAQQALLRELREELGIQAEIRRPLWVNQAFFTEDVSGEKYHELCFYFLVDVENTALPGWGDSFQRQEGARLHRFTWLPLSRLREEYLYPEFIKEHIFHLPECLELMEEHK